MLSGTCVVFGFSKGVWRMSRATVNTATSWVLALSFTIFGFSFAVTFSLAILAGLIAAASWWFQALRVSAHVLA